MDNSLEPIQPVRKNNQFAIASFILGLLTVIFPVIALIYLAARNGGAGYLQSLFCGVPVAFASLITGSIALVQIRRKNQAGAGQAAGQGAWMAIAGTTLGIIIFGIDIIMAAVLILPFILGNAQ